MTQPFLKSKSAAPMISIGIGCLAFLSVIFSLSNAIAAPVESDPATVYVSRIWNKTDGLPQDSVTALLQTRDGFLWVGTQNGLVRFDGVHFRAQVFPGVTNEPVWITDLCEDRDGRLWVGTHQHGLFCFDNGQSRQLKKENGLVDDFVTSLAVDASQKIWIGTRNGLDVLDGSNLRRITERDGLPDENISSVYVARSGTIWITTRSGVCVWRDNRVQPYEFDADSQGRRPQYLGVYEDRKKNLWAFGDTYLINLAEGKRFNYFRGGGASSSRIWSLYESHDGSLWIGTSGQGLFQFSDDRFHPVAIRAGKVPNDVRSICEDREGDIWLGTDGGGLVQLRRERLRILGANDGLPASLATCLAVGADKKIWAAFAGQGLFHSDGDHFELDNTFDGVPVNSLAADNAGGLWIATAGSGLSVLRQQELVHFDSANGLASDFVTAVGASTNGTIWAGTQSGQFYIFDHDRLQWRGNVHGAITALLVGGTNELSLGTDAGGVTEFKDGALIPILKPGLPAARVSSLRRDVAGRLWIGTVGRGLFCNESNSLKNWNQSEGLSDDDVSSLVFDAENNLWLTTASGIFYLANDDLKGTLKTGEISGLRRVQSFAAGEMTAAGWPASLLSSDGRLWFATAQGVIRYDPRGWHPDNTPPVVYLETVSVNDQPFLQLDSTPAAQNKFAVNAVKLPAHVQSLDFEYTSPCLSIPEKAQFFYKLDGLDADWVKGDSLNRQIHYGTIGYGRYKFRIKACNPDGTWNQEAVSFSFIVPLPWWQTWWALGFFAIAAIFLVTAIVRIVSHRRLHHRLQSLEQSQAMARERMRIAQDMHDEIGSKLAKISFLSEGVKNELGGIETHAEKVSSIADTSRDLLQSLDQMVWAVNPRNDTLEHLVAYLGQHAVEYFQNTSVLCDVHLPQHLPAVPLSAEVRHNVLLAFEEALGNALKHSCARRVNIDMKHENQILEITIADDGAGFDPQKSASASDLKSGRERRGLSGMKLRLQMAGGECDFKSADGTGTVIQFRIPLKNGLKNKA